MSKMTDSEINLIAQKSNEDAIRASVVMKRLGEILEAFSPDTDMDQFYAEVRQCQNELTLLSDNLKERVAALKAHKLAELGPNVLPFKKP